VQSPNVGLGFPKFLSDDRYYVESFWHGKSVAHRADLAGLTPRQKGCDLPD